MYIAYIILYNFKITEFLLHMAPHITPQKQVYYIRFSI